MTDDGTKGDDVAADGVWTFQYSKNLGKHDGLLVAGQQATFVFAFDASGNLEYKVSDEDGSFPPTTGVMAYLDYGNGFVDATIQNQPDGDRNTYVEPAPFTPPANHVAVNFCVDDTANQSYATKDGLAWSGSFSFDADTRVASYDDGWGGPFPMLYDDGPWDQGGHEPAGATAGDHIWCVTIWIDNTAEQAFDYGAIRGSVDGSNGGWIWNGDGNGSFTVTSGATEAIDAAGMSIPAWGDTDLRLTLDLSSDGANLYQDSEDPHVVDFTGVAWTNPEVKSSATAWELAPMYDDGTHGDAAADDGIYTWTLSKTQNPNDGKLSSGAKAEFIFVFERPNGDADEYKRNNVGYAEGVGAYLDDANGTFSEVTIMGAGAGNTYVEVP